MQALGIRSSNKLYAEPKLHIILYSPFPYYTGGREVWLYNILDNLKHSALSIYLYTLKPASETKFFDLSNTNVTQVVIDHSVSSKFPRSTSLSWFTKFANYLRAFFLYPFRAKKALSCHLSNGDIVLALNPIIDTAPAILLKREKKNDFLLACEVHGLVSIELSRALPITRPIFTFLEKYSLSQTDLILANGYDTQVYLEQLGFESKVVPNGADIKAFMQPSHVVQNDMAKELRERNFLIVGVIGALRPIKGVYEAIECIRYLKNLVDQPFKFVFIGKGEKEPYLKFAQKLDVEDYVIFAGEHKNIPEFVQIFDIALCPAFGSGMLIAARECMAAGKPVVAWDNLMYRQMITSGESGLLVEEKNSHELAITISKLLKDEELRKRLGLRAQEVSLSYDWSNVSKQLLEGLGLNV